MVSNAPRREQILDWLSEVADPEIPVLTITDLGIVRDVDCSDAVTVSLAPTYSGCPATEAIERSVVTALEDRGVSNVRIKRVLSPPWTTDWITPEGRDKLRVYGIAPPKPRDGPVACPRCDSENTEIVSEFGSTACKAAYKCTDCLEPFEYFKCL
ncbi:MAG: phenylacetate-CoA oxygenase subunit PaaJ [Gammaproteobacteria bacterium]|nr:phenylacetate-CoA oxygenase subunit PaaJ [Gammaproteobacteria bacterium]